MEKCSLVLNLAEEFGQQNLVYFAWQIAKGMAFLISRNVIHSCRNFGRP